jgi:LmbE family N-acetylglucosaminyl deacetylase
MVACRRVGRVYCFQSPSATVDYRPTRFVTIDDHIERKLKAIDAFGSQTGVRDYLDPGLIASTARYWSRYCGGSHAEPFEAIRDRAGSQLATP